MALRIGKPLLQRVRTHLKRQWRDKEWHMFDNLPQVEAIVAALALNGHESDEEIISYAKKYYKVNQEAENA